MDRNGTMVVIESSDNGLVAAAVLLLWILSLPRSSSSPKVRYTLFGSCCLLPSPYVDRGTLNCRLHWGLFLLPDPAVVVVVVVLVVVVFVMVPPPPRTGKSQRRIWRMAGMQAHMMPTLSSMVDQYWTSKLSKVGLVELTKVTRDWRRRTETTVTL